MGQVLLFISEKRIENGAVIKYLVIKNLRAPRITASNHVVVGVPGPGAFYGLGYNIVRALNDLEARERPQVLDLAELTRFSVAVASLHLANTRKKPTPIDEKDKHKQHMSMVDECIGDLTFSLVLELRFSGDGALPDDQVLRKLIRGLRFAGSYLDVSGARLYEVDNHIAALQRLRGRSFLLRDLTDEIVAGRNHGERLSDLYKQLLTSGALTAAAVTDQGTGDDQPLGSVLEFGEGADNEGESSAEGDVDVSTSENGLASDMPPQEEYDGFGDMFESSQEKKQADSKQNKDDATEAYHGRILPTLIGYRLLEAPRKRTGARRGYEHAFAEPLIGLLRAQLVGSVLATREREGRLPPVFFRPRTIRDEILVYSALDDAEFERIVTAIGF